MEEAIVRDRLGAERETTLARIGAMIAEFQEIVAGTTDSNSDDEHDPEGSTIAFERAQIAALLLEARAYLGDLDRALERLDAGSYWTCDRCGRPIARERLAARPATQTCIECAAAAPRRNSGRGSV
jgi:RNA polymerase-binding transcription factor DksA